MFYTGEEMAIRMATLYNGNMLASSFSGLIAAAVFQLDQRHGLAGWQWLFEWLKNTFILPELRLTIPDHPRSHLKRHRNSRHLHAPGQSIEDSLAHTRGERTCSPSHLR
jgi:hypothetical protein